MDIADISIDVPRAYFILEQFVDKSFSMGIIELKLKDRCPCRWVHIVFLYIIFPALNANAPLDVCVYCWIYLSVCSVSPGDGRDLSARETVDVSNLKATEEPNFYAGFPRTKKKKKKAISFLNLHIFQNSWIHFSPSVSQKNVCFWNLR